MLVSPLLRSLIPNQISTPLLELTLLDSHIMARECAEMAMQDSLKQLRVLNLSCNPIKLEGLCNLLSNTSKLDNLHEL